MTTLSWGNELNNETVFLLSFVELGYDGEALPPDSNHGLKVVGIDPYVNINERYWTRSVNSDNTYIVDQTGGGSSSFQPHGAGVRPAVNLDSNSVVYGPYGSGENEYYSLFEPDRVEFVKGLIDALPMKDDVTLDDKGDIEAVRSEFDDLSPVQKAQVTNVSKLEDLEARIADLKVATPVVQNVRNLYESLDADQQALVTNLAKLIEAEQRLSDIMRPRKITTPITVLLSERAGWVATVERKSSNGDNKIDVVKVDKQALQSAAEQLLDEQSGTTEGLVITIKSDEEDPADTYHIELTTEVISVISDILRPLHVNTEFGSVQLSSELIRSLEDTGQNVVIEIQSIRNEEEILRIQESIHTFDPQLSIIGNHTKMTIQSFSL